MTTEQQEKLLALEITLPKEYNFGELGDEDFEKIVLSRDKGQPQDIPHIRYTMNKLVLFSRFSDFHHWETSPSSGVEEILSLRGEGRG